MLRGASTQDAHTRGGIAMSDYLLLFGGGKMPETKEEQDAVMAA
jgi:hypothetical protein